MACLRKSALYLALDASFGVMTVTAVWLFWSDRQSSHGMLIWDGFGPINGGAVAAIG